MKIFDLTLEQTSGSGLEQGEFHVYELHVQHMVLTVQNLVYQLGRKNSMINILEYR